MLPSSDSSSTKRGRRKEARPGELLDAALDLFVEKGFAATKVEEVAARAGVSKGTLFLYFPSKEELFKAVVRENISGRFAEWEAELTTFCGSCSEMVEYALNAWWERIGSTKANGLGRLMMSEAGNFPDLALFYRTEVVLPAQGLIRKILTLGMASGEFRKLDLDYAIYLVEAPLMQLDLMMSSKSFCIANPEEFDALKYLQMHADNLLVGLRPRAA
ncbi:TetR/AcrR family transcriptional regulator [Diaphorobacter aerolatus]|uniref:TetR/AcrR family transcriptional regulator n=1 Tax=Diaphorobacter aerolatus TaxID=1288495 RepID=A0A7H0GKV8_9BURK|nr:TetR/AcrR family transcriptional regulator [Diaphorobacter aerolatus]QNP48924.1 TetR/AcrR family transcriptional regulator [Diaphorobacter aerolatus]